MALSSTQAEVKANEYLDLAIAALTKIRVFNKDKKWEESAAYFVKAAEHFKLARQHHEAGDAYVKAAEQLEESPRADEATEMYMLAAKAYKTAGSMKDAAKMYDKVVVVYQAKNNFSHAGKLYRELAEMEEKEKRYKEALETYEKAADAYMAADVTSHANECLLRVAELAASEALYEKAREIFEKVAVAASKNNLIKTNANEYLLKAAICCLPQCMEKNDDGAYLGRTLERYKELVMHFEKSREFTMINKVLDAYELRDPEEFTNAIYDYDKHTRVQGWMARVLLDAKNFIKNPDTLKDFDDEALM